MPNEGDLFSLMGKLDLTLGQLAGQTKRRADQQERLDRRARIATQPSKVVFSGSAIVPASGFVVISLTPGGPRQGYLWDIHRLSVSGVTPSTSIAGRADVFISAMPYSQVTSFAQVSMADWADQATTLPLVGTYGDGEMTLLANERIHVILSGGTSTQVVIVNGVAKQSQDAAHLQTTEV